MIAIAAGIEISEENMEYVSEHWARPYAEALLDNGDRQIQRFSLDKEVPRKVAIRSLLQAFGVKFVYNAEPYENQPFTDMPLPTIYDFDGYIYTAYDLGIVKGVSEGIVNPDEALTRAEIVTLIERALMIDDWTIPQPECLENLKITFIGETNKLFYNEIALALYKFPDNFLKEFSEKGGEIVITNESPNVYGNFKTNVSGLCFPSNGKIIIFTNGRIPSPLFSIQEVLRHEMGHYMFYRVLSSIDRNEITRIFNEGIEPQNLSEILHSNYCTTSVDEFFAEMVEYSLSFRVISSKNRNNDVIESLKIIQNYIPMELYKKEEIIQADKIEIKEYVEENKEIEK